MLKDSKSRMYMAYRRKKKCLQNIFKKGKQRDPQGYGMEKKLHPEKKGRRSPDADGEAKSDDRLEVRM